MDNRIANDMISSGMIPSGEKNKEDLSRTQYGSAPSPSKLMDAYKSMYDKKDEVINEHHKKDADGNTIPHEGEEVNEAIQFAPLLGKIATGLKATKAGTLATKAFTKVKGIAKSPLGQQVIGQGITGSMNQPKEKINKSGMITAGADLFDIVKGKLLDEGLSEEEIKDIMLTLTPDEIMKEMNQGPSTPVSIDKVEFPKPGKKVMPKTGATYIGKVRPKPGFKMNPASGEVEKNENV